MPVPAAITDLSTTASSNSPAGSETPTDGDNYLRALSAFIAQLNANKYDKTGGALTGNVSTTGDVSASGDVILNGVVVSSNGAAATPSYTFGSFQTAGFYSNAGEVSITVGGVKKMSVESTGDVITSPAATPPTLSANGQLVMNLTSNTNLRISARGSDGVTRVANITLA